MSTLRFPAINDGVHSGLTLHFDRLSVLILSKEALLYTPLWKEVLGAVEWVKSFGVSLLY